jgi:hypothetical protein
MKIIDPLEGVNIGKAKNLKDGRLPLKCENYSNLKQTAKNKLSQLYEVRKVNSLRPRIRISDVPDNIREKYLILRMKRKMYLSLVKNWTSGVKILF